MDYLNLNPGYGASVPAAGKLLIAEPLLNDPNFARSVVLLCEHGAEGSLGFVLNQATEYTLQDVLPELVAGAQVPIFQGGPVQADTLHMIHSYPGNDGLEIVKGVFWGGSYDSLRKIALLHNTSSLRLFMGYSGWGPGQLQHEMEEGTWLVADATAHLLFNTQPQDIWKRAIEGLGSKYAFLSNMPTDPLFN